MSGQEFSGEGLLRALEEQAVAPKAPSGITLVGMVKQSKEPECIAFAPAGCDSWVDIPTRLIEKAVQLDDRRCNDHAHVVFRITLKEPADTEGRLLGKLLMASAGRWGGELPPSFAQMAVAAQRGGGGGGGGFDCDIPCQALLKVCLEKTPFSSAVCVLLYQICYATCRFPGPIIDIFGAAAR